MEIFQLHGNGLEYLPAFASSLGIGLLIGLERERSPAARAGLRTFALVAMLGTLTAMLSDKMDFPLLLAVGLAVVGVSIVTAYVSRPAPEGDPGTTTEAALLLCYGLGAAVWFGYVQLSAVIAVTTTILLYFKPELKGFTQTLRRRDLLSILQFAVLSLVILPLLPNRGYGPYGVLNPYNIWLMVVLIAGVSLVGYVALLLSGRRYGAPLLGFLGGLVSSTATTLVYARHGKSYEGMRSLAVMVILLANLVVLLRLAVLAAVVAPAVLRELLPVLISGAVPGVVVTALSWRKLNKPEELPIPEIRNPTELGTSILFGALYGAVLFFSAWLSELMGSKGLYGVALASGLTDVDAITLSSFRLFSLGSLSAHSAAVAVIFALLANLAFKFSLVATVGGRNMARVCAPGFGAIALGCGVALTAI